MTTHRLLIVLSIATMASCKEHGQRLDKPFFNSKGKQIGDSTFIDGLVSRIVFSDSSYIIDSIVFYRQRDPDRLLSKKTFKNGKKIFENVDYYEDGRVKTYDFISADGDVYYERLYSKDGKVRKINGELFFQDYVPAIDPNTLEVKKGTTLHYKVFYPNPPDCDANVYVKYKNGALLDVFAKNPLLDFLQQTSNDTHELGAYEVNILLELKDKKDDSISRYNQSVFFKVVP